MRENILDHFQIYLLRGKKEQNLREFYFLYDKSFKMWHETWQNTYSHDFHSTQKLASDEFTRQDEILTLYYKGECVALCFFSNANMIEEHAKLDSYFECWPKKAIEGLSAEGNNIIICSQFTVSEKFRKVGVIELDNIPWKIMLMGMLSKYFLESGKDAMTGTMRVSKGVEKLTYQFGAIPLIEKLEYQAGADTTLVDLVAFFQTNVKEAYYGHFFSNILDEAWSYRNYRLLKKVA